MCYNTIVMVNDKKDLKDEFISIVMDSDMKIKLKEIAGKKKISVSTLSRIWLTEKLNSIKI